MPSQGFVVARRYLKGSFRSVQADRCQVVILGRAVFVHDAVQQQVDDLGALISHGNPDRDVALLVVRRWVILACASLFRTNSFIFPRLQPFQRKCRVQTQFIVLIQ